MSPRAHLWLRVVALSAIVVAQMIPRGSSHAAATNPSVEPVPSMAPAPSPPAAPLAQR